MKVTVLPACHAVFLMRYVVPALDLETAGDQVRDHVVTEVGVVVDRRHREVAALVVDLVALVAADLLTSGVPPALDRVDVVVLLVRVRAEPDRVEDVELGLGAEVAGVGHTGRGQVLLGLTGHVARVAAVGLAGDRVVHEEVDVERLVLAERVEARGRRVREQSHVGLVDRLETADRGAVEGDAVVEEVLVDRRGRDGEVLHDAGKVAEPDVDVLDTLVRDVAQELFGVVEHPL
jgi:hypothetical protein